MRRALQVDLDMFLERAVEEWLDAEREKHVEIVSAFVSWAGDGATPFTFEEFSRMLRFANPHLLTTAKISQASSSPPPLPA